MIALYMLANIDGRIKDKILIQYYSTTCVMYDFKNAEYKYVLTLFLNYSGGYWYVECLVNDFVDSELAKPKPQ